jgi:hypothetical protein
MRRTGQTSSVGVPMTWNTFSIWSHGQSLSTWPPGRNGARCKSCTGRSNDRSVGCLLQYKIGCLLCRLPGTDILRPRYSPSPICQRRRRSSWRPRAALAHGTT